LGATAPEFEKGGVDSLFTPSQTPSQNIESKEARKIIPRKNLASKEVRYSKDLASDFVFCLAALITSC
jgi:hypothetical protein